MARSRKRQKRQAAKRMENRKMVAREIREPDKKQMEMRIRPASVSTTANRAAVGGRRSGRSKYILI